MKEATWLYIEKELINLQKHMTKFDTAADSVMIPLGSPLREPVDYIACSVVDALDQLTGIDDYWINWFAWENDFGANGLLVRGEAEEREVQTLEDLKWCIETCSLIGRV